MTAADAEQMAVVANWIGGLFLAPQTAEALERHLEAGDLLEEIGQQLDCLAGTRRMNEVLAKAPIEVISKNLERRYFALFEGMAGRHTVPLYESGYAGTGTRLFQQPVTDMECLLRDLDLSVEATCCEPADHISIELAVLAAALRSGNGEIARSLAQRLSRWGPGFVARLCEEDGDEFYGAAAVVLYAFILALPNLVSCQEIAVKAADGSL
ncbi:MAG: TorD/DmsD family molecular chaperone [Allorhizobium sp.]